MNEDFLAAMRRALQHVRAQDVVAATGIIQAALAGRSPVDREFSKLPVDITPRQDGEPARHRLTVPEVNRDPCTNGNEKVTRRGTTSPSRQRRPLGDVLRTLQTLRKSLRVRPHVTPSLPDLPAGAQFLTRTYRCSAGERTYKLYIPSGLSGQPSGLIVMLHGCTQDPDDFAIGTHMNAHAETHRLLIAYPAQSRRENVSSCWNWFRPEDQQRGAGEPAILAGLTRSIAEEFDLEPERIFIAGFSAGGAMTSVMLATYPELYAAGCIHSGLAYKSANDVVTALAAMRGQSDPRGVAAPVSTASGGRKIIFHGSQDPIVHPSNAESIFAAAHSGEPDNQLHRKRMSDGRGTRRSVVMTSQGETITEYWLIDGAGHAWSGGRSGGSYTDPSGPDASAEMIRFFLNRT